MVKQTVKCSLGRKILEIYEGSNVDILLKCNQQKCKQKRSCKRMQIIKIGVLKGDENVKYNQKKCTACGHRVFDASNNSHGMVEIKCTNCGNIVNILIGNGVKNAYAA